MLQHISHPSIVAYLHSFTTPAHHCLVLEYVGGGELFDLINSDESYASVTEPLLRRMWGELAKAVGWMHGVALVHRDIKLESESDLPSNSSYLTIVARHSPHCAVWIGSPSGSFTAYPQAHGLRACPCNRSGRSLATHPLRLGVIRCTRAPSCDCDVRRRRLR